MKPISKFEIDGDMLNAMIGTISRLPYAEVAPIMDALKQPGAVVPIPEREIKE
jgi:hypothetical protein